MNSASSKNLENEVTSQQPSLVSMSLCTPRFFKKQSQSKNSNLNKSNLLSGFENECRFTIPENEEVPSSIFEESKEERSQTLRLSKVTVPTLTNGDKNVFMSGNVPPWLKSKLDIKSTPQNGNGSNMLGPSIEGFLRSKEIEKQKDRGKSRKLGSTFDHSQKPDSAWLPNFGRVWEEGPRFMSRFNYQKSTKDKSDSKSQ